jgi:hypothetical protein
MAHVFSQKICIRNPDGFDGFSLVKILCLRAGKLPAARLWPAALFAARLSLNPTPLMLAEACPVVDISVEMRERR